jgi:hypothetical protein
VRSVSTQPSSQEVVTVDEEEDPKGSISLKFNLATLPTSSKIHRTSKVWDYFADFDLTKHPTMSLYRICLICREMQVDKAIKIGPNLSPGPLITHLKVHPHEHSFYVAAKHTIATATSSQKSILPFFQEPSDTKLVFK